VAIVVEYLLYMPPFKESSDPINKNLENSPNVEGRRGFLKKALAVVAMAATPLAHSENKKESYEETRKRMLNDLQRGTYTSLTRQVKNREETIYLLQNLTPDDLIRLSAYTTPGTVKGIIEDNSKKIGTAVGSVVGIAGAHLMKKDEEVSSETVQRKQIGAVIGAGVGLGIGASADIALYMAEDELLKKDAGVKNFINTLREQNSPVTREAITQEINRLVKEKEETVEKIKILQEDPGFKDWFKID
jgi:hypothetical protein